MPKVLKENDPKKDPPVNNWGTWLSKHGYPEATFSRYMPGLEENSGMLEIFKKGNTSPTYLQIGPSQFDQMKALTPQEPVEQAPAGPSDTNILLQGLQTFMNRDHGAGYLRHPATPKSVDDAFNELGYGNKVGAQMMRDQWANATDEKKDELMRGYERAYKRDTNQ